MAKQADEERGEKPTAGIGRREMIKLTAGAVIAPALPQTGPKNGSGPTKAKDGERRFFTSDEFAMLDELSELIIPTDEHSPGARAAKVAEYIDGVLAESFTDEPKLIWREGLKLIDQISVEMNRMPFMQASEDQRVAVLTRMASSEQKPEKPEGKFFVNLKSSIARVYYTSKIGIHDELEYKGNTYLKEFVGVDVSKG
ncbi:MAG: gluconate 2-dehydrogenase subunit 3 family protein [Chloracidobacterium sp.]|nr:gluconate 2-dehydrogenase subunit 3 family protein [Chloracidobacterium sp.]